MIPYNWAGGFCFSFYKELFNSSAPSSRESSRENQEGVSITNFCKILKKRERLQGRKEGRSNSWKQRYQATEIQLLITHLGWGIDCGAKSSGSKTPNRNNQAHIMSSWYSFSTFLGCFQMPWDIFATCRETLSKAILTQPYSLNGKSMGNSHHDLCRITSSLGQA